MIAKITVKLGKKEVDLTLPEAKRLHDELAKLFAPVVVPQPRPPFQPYRGINETNIGARLKANPELDDALQGFNANVPESMPSNKTLFVDGTPGRSALAKDDPGKLS